MKFLETKKTKKNKTKKTTHTHTSEITSTLIEYKNSNYQTNKEWGMKKSCHLVATLGSNNLKPVKMGLQYPQAFRDAREKSLLSMNDLR